MNSLEGIVNIDERVTQRHGKKRYFYGTILYALIDYRQWPYVISWLKSLKSTPYDDKMPWITYRAVNYLQKHLVKDSVIFEYGSGGSTLFYADYAKKVVSVEHDKQWHKLIKPHLAEYSSIDYRLKESQDLSKEQLMKTAYRSTRELEVGFEDYVRSIEDFSDEYFDLVSIDGRCRAECVKAAYAKVKKGGIILLDNSERKDYFAAYLYMYNKGLSPIDLYGLGGYETIPWQTTIWIK